MTRKPNGNNKDEDIVPSRATSLAPRSAGPTDLNQFIDSVFRGFDTSLSQLFPSFSAFTEASPSVDLIDHGDHYTLTAELPGYTKDEVDVRVDENTLELSAERKEQKEKKEK